MHPREEQAVAVATVDEGDAELALALARGVGPRLRQVLLEHFGSARAVLQAAPSRLREIPGVGVKLCRAILAAEAELQPAALRALCREQGIELLFAASARYPPLLRQIHDPPTVLFMQGELQAGDGLAVAIVGTRHASHYGLRQATQLAAGLARAGMTVVSGLARGIDGAAHRAALSARGRTIAVLGGGLLRVYPPEHRELAQAITRQGAVLCECHPQAAPKASLFPQRNRVISGLAVGLVVVEAAEHSGALVSARHALEQGREVFAVPGPVDSRTSRGCHQLLRDGAKLVESVDDILEELGPLAAPVAGPGGRLVRWPAELELNEQERSVLDQLGTDPVAIDDLAARSQLPVARILATISALEMRRIVRRISGQLVVRV